MRKSAVMYATARGLYLQVSKSGSRSWVFRFDFGGQRREMGLGSARVVSLNKLASSHARGT